MGFVDSNMDDAADISPSFDLTARSTRLERKIFAECVAVLLQLFAAGSTQAATSRQAVDPEGC